MKVGIIDYGVGNLGSVAKAFEVAGASPRFLADPDEVPEIDCVVLPGVGNFADCARRLNRLGWERRIVERCGIGRLPILGICVGMQLLGDRSEEGTEHDIEPRGLGLIPGDVRNLRSLGCQSRLPHVGWNDVEWLPGHHPSAGAQHERSDFYFVHSYALVPKDPLHVAATCRYDVDFSAAVRNGHVWGTQFHPEKSSLAGLSFIRHFLESLPCSR